MLLCSSFSYMYDALGKFGELAQEASIALGCALSISLNFIKQKSSINLNEDLFFNGALKILRK